LCSGGGCGGRVAADLEGDKIVMKILLNLTWLLLLLLSASEAGAGAGIVVTDDDGNTITLQRPAQRVISMAPNITELLFAAGGGNLIVGTVSYSDFPEAAKKIPQIGDNREVDLERIIALKPDLLVAWRHVNSDRQDQQLRSLNIPLYYCEPRTMAAIPSSVKRLGQLMGTEAQADKTAMQLQQKLEALTSRYARRSPVRMFYQVWDKPLFTLNGQHIVSDAVRICGGVNIFSDLKILAPTVSIEAVLQKDPEAIIGTAEEHPSDGGVALWQRYPSMTAVKHHNLFLLDGNLLNRAGPRMLDGAAAMCEKLDAARGNRQ